MNCRFFPYDLQLKHPFGVAGNTRTTTKVLFAEFTQNQFIGLGEASFPPYLSYSREAALTELCGISIQNITGFEDIPERLALLTGQLSPPSLAAVDIALHDLAGKINNISISKFYGTGNLRPKNCFTIGLDDPGKIPQKLKESEPFHLIKIKLGGGNDIAVLETILSNTNKQLCLDINQGWRTSEEAFKVLDLIRDSDIAFIEQPFPKEYKIEYNEFFRKSPFPVLADESFQTINDLENINGKFHGINVKLMKCGGIFNAFQIIKSARSKGLKVLIGSMNESSCANMAAAQLGALADWTDLDGPFLISNNPFQDPEIIDGRIVLGDIPGIGVKTQASI